MKMVYKQNVIEALQFLADPEFQKVAWFPNDKNLMASYNENVMWVFDDTGLGDALKTGDIIFGKEADNALRDLEAATDKIEGTDYPADILIDMPEMQIIREKATKALALVKISNDSESTVKIVE